MNSPQYYKKLYKTSKEFLQWIYSHPLVSTELERDIQDMLWKDKPDIQEFYFGGKYGTQFQSVEEIKSFDEEFNKLLRKHSVDHKHKANLLYCITFLNHESDVQSHRHNLHNSLIEYARFILDIVKVSQRLFEYMCSNEEYKLIEDEYTRDYVFVRKSLLETIGEDDVIHTTPQTKKVDDILRYQRLLIYNREILLPPNLNVELVSHQKIKLKELAEMKIANISVPQSYRSMILNRTITDMLKAHEDNDTDFYKALKDSTATEADFDDIYRKFKKHSFVKATPLKKVGLIISDYLKENHIIKTPVAISRFVFGYFALTKALPVEDKDISSSIYSDIYATYTRNGVNDDWVRNMLKDANKIREKLV